MVAPASAALLVLRSITDARPAPNLLPNANSSVAPSVIQGRTRMNVWAGVFNSRYAPARPPSKLTLNNGIMTRRGTSRRLRYAPPLAAAAVHNAIVLVALAGMGGTPVHNSAGKAMKPPPPATELSAPPTPPATNRKTMVSRVKLLGVPERARLRQLTPSPVLTYFCYCRFEKHCLCFGVDVRRNEDGFHARSSRRLCSRSFERRGLGPDAKSCSPPEATGQSGLHARHGYVPAGHVEPERHADELRQRRRRCRHQRPRHALHGRSHGHGTAPEDDRPAPGEARRCCPRRASCGGSAQGVGKVSGLSRRAGRRIQDLPSRNSAENVPLHQRRLRHRDAIPLQSRASHIAAL